MKQNKLKTLALVLALALVLTLAVGMFVACDPKDSDPSENDNSSAVFSLEQQNGLIGYCFSAVEARGACEAYFDYRPADALRDSETPMETANGLMKVTLYLATGEYDATTDAYSDENEVLLCYSSSPEETTEALNLLKEQNADDLDFLAFASTIGNIAVLESKQGMFENYISKATLPSTVSDARKQYFKKGYDMMSKAFSYHSDFSFGKETLEDGEVMTSECYEVESQPKVGNCTEVLAYSSTGGENIDMAKASFDSQKYLYTDDSYFSATKEEGYMFEYFKYKPGSFAGSVISYGENEGKLEIHRYYYDTEVIENLTFPAKIYDKTVAVVYLYDAISAKNISVEEGILSLSLSDNLLKNITLPTSLTYLTLSSKTIETLTLPTNLNSVNLACESLKTVNYAGSTADFEAKFANYANDWCHVQAEWDNTTHQYIYKDITITVVCNNGSLTYPQKEAQN